MRQSWLIVVACGAMAVASSAIVLSKNQDERNGEQPMTMSAVAPSYPVLAVASNTSGEVAVRVKVDREGLVTSARAIEGHVLLRAEAAKVARRWCFRPLANAPERTASLRFVFRIVPRETSDDELTAVFTLPNQVEVRHRPFQEVVDSDPPNSMRGPSRPKKKSSR